MKLNLGLGATVLLVCGMAGAIGAPSPAHAVLQGQSTPRLVVKYKSTATAPAAALQAQSDGRANALSVRARTQLRQLKVMANGAVVYHMGQELTLEQAQVAAARIAQDPDVEYAEPDVRVYASQVAAVTNDSYAHEQWPLMPRSQGTGNSAFSAAWGISRGEDMVVGVVDSGVTAHPDLVGQIVPGYDFIPESSSSGYASAGDGDGRDSDPTDPGDFCDSKLQPSSWHGTKVTGLIVALSGNNYGISGAAPGAKVMPLRVLGRCDGFMSDTADALSWSVGVSLPGLPTNYRPVDVVNLSLGGAPGTACYNYIQEAVTAAISRNIPVVVSAGNDGGVRVGPPANCAGVITVGAHTRSGDVAGYSNLAASVALTGPAGGACRTQTANCQAESPVTTGNAGKAEERAPISNAYFSGTSAAAPHVSAAVALIRAINPALTPAEILSILKATASPHAADSHCATNPNDCGAGMLDAAAAAAMATGPAASIKWSFSGDFVPSNKSVVLTAQVTNGLGSTYAWQQLSGAPVTLSGANTASASFLTPATRANLSFKVTVVTSYGTTVSATQTVVVNNPPVLASKSFNAKAGEQTSFALEATDPDGDAVVISLINGPSNLTLKGTTLEWISPYPSGSHPVTVHLIDASGLVTRETLTITVSSTTPSGNPATSGDGGGGGGSSDLVFLALVGAALATLKSARR